jgi:hypothetical protein
MMMNIIISVIAFRGMIRARFTVVTMPIMITVRATTRPFAALASCVSSLHRTSGREVLRAS